MLLPTGALGPGKIALMRGIAATGSVSAAARRLRMSHARSVQLVAAINALGAGPLILTRTGGGAGGGATLTERGQAVLDAHARLAAVVAEAAAAPLAALTEVLGDPPRQG